MNKWQKVLFFAYEADWMQKETKRIEEELQDPHNDVTDLVTLYKAASELQHRMDLSLEELRKFRNEFPD